MICTAKSFCLFRTNNLAPPVALGTLKPRGGAEGMASDIAIVAQEILKTRERLNALYVQHTKQPLDRIEKVMDR